MWNREYANSSCNNKERLLVHKEHLERLFQIKGQLDNSDPLKPKFLKIKAYKKQNEKEYRNKLIYENRVLFSKMHDISSKPSPYGSAICKPVYCPAFDKSTYSWGERIKKIDLKKRNQFLYKRFNTAKTFYPMKTLEHENDFNRYLSKNMSRKHINPNIYYVTYAQFRKNVENELNNPSSFSQKQSRCLSRAQSACKITLGAVGTHSTTINKSDIKPRSSKSRMTNKSTNHSTYHIYN